MRHLLLSLLCLICLGFILSSCRSEPEENVHLKNNSTGQEQENDKQRIVIYQLMTRLFGNKNSTNKTYGTIQENGVGKFNEIDEIALEKIKDMGITHVWYTGVLEHATMVEYNDFGMPADDADVVKGRAGSPYAIKDYYDVNPYLAEDPMNRFPEWEMLMERTHNAGLKVMIDFVPNHVARSYKSDAKPQGVIDLGEKDNHEVAFDPNNNFYYIVGEEFKVPEGYDPLGPGEVAPGEDGEFAESPAKATGNNVFSSQPSEWDWFETVKLNYGVDYQNGESKVFDPQPQTWGQMRDILKFWVDKGVDGFRCDMAEMVPVEFWAWVIPEIKKINPKVIFVAEIYNPDEYKNYVNTGKFDFLYDKVGVYDSLRVLMTGKGSSRSIGQALRQSAGLDGKMLRFLENHDEQRVASTEFAGDPRRGLPGMIVSAGLSTGPMMMYFGQEVGEPGRGKEGFQGDDGRTTIFDFWGVKMHQLWMNGGTYDGGKLSGEQLILREQYIKLLKLCNEAPALREGMVLQMVQPEEVLQEGESPKTFSIGRFTNDQKLVVVANFHPIKEKDVLVIMEQLEAMGIEVGKNYKATDLMGSGNDATFEGNEGSFRVTLQPMSGYIYELTSE